MGQKINPIIFRKSISRPEIASWISPKDKFFHIQDQDLEIRNFLSLLLKSRGIILRSCKILRSSQKLQIELDFYFSYVLAKQSKSIWARSIFKTIKKDYDSLSKIRDLKDFIQDAELASDEDIDDFVPSLPLKALKKSYRKRYFSLSSKGKRHYLKLKKKRNFIFGTKVLTFKHRYLFFLLLKNKKSQPLVKKSEEDFSILSSLKNSSKSNIVRLGFSKLKRLFVLERIPYTFQKYHLSSDLKLEKLKSYLSVKKKKTPFFLSLNKFLCKSLHNFTGFESINLKIYSSQLSYLSPLKLYQRTLKEELFFLHKNKDLKKYFSESIEVLYFVLTTFGYGNAYLLSMLVAYMIENNRKHTLITRFLKKSIDVFFESLPRNCLALDGIIILVKGRFNKRRRTKTIVVQKGDISLQTIKTPLDYHQTQAITIYGSFGIKVWLAKKL